MESDIRIVQSALRPNRINKDFSNKKAYIIIPCIDTNDFTINNESFDKCRKIIAKLRNVDENIECKINVNSIALSNKSDSNTFNNSTSTGNYDVIENGIELNKIMLRLRHSKALSTQCSDEQDEYSYVRELNKQLNIQSKDVYTNDDATRKKHQMYIEKPDEYFRLKAVWNNWYDFLGVDTKKFIQNKQDWIKFCKQNNVKSSDDYDNLCKLHDNLPANPADFYKDFSSISNELGFIRPRRK